MGPTMMALIDTHCHLNHSDLADDLPAVLDRAAEAGVSRTICAGYDMESSMLAVDQARALPGVYATIGVHPHDASKFRPRDEERLLKLCEESEGRVVAVGETGLDFHYNLSPHGIQRQVYRLHIRLAKTMGLPLVIHSREAGEEILEILAEEGLPGRGAVLHCFSGGVEEACRAVEMGCHLGIAGTITFKNASALRQTIENLPLDRLIVETDAPYLAPDPYRGKRNEPAYVRIVAQKLAEVLDVPQSEIASATTSNAERLFRLAGE